MGGGGDTTTSTQTSGSALPAVGNTLTQLLSGGPNSVQGVFNAGPKVFGQSLYSPQGATTTAAQNASLAAAGNPQYASGVNSALGANNALLSGNGLTSGQNGTIGTSNSVANQYGGLTANGGLTSGQTGNLGTVNGIGNQFGNLASGAGAPSLTEQQLMNVATGGAFGTNDPGFAALRSKAGDDALRTVNAAFNSNGRFGGDSNIKTAGEGVGNALAGLDYQNFQNDIARQQQALNAIENQRQQGFTNQSNSLANELGAAGNAFNMGQTGTGNILSALSGQLGASGQAFNQGQTGIANQQAALGNLGSLFAALQAPAATQAAVGAAQDQNAQNILSGQADLFNRQNNAALGQLQSIFPLLTGASGAGPTTTSVTQPATPWWQTAAALGLAAL